ncbi:MAG: NAD(P)H-hydrate dehydratase [Trueperaceae bacterium]|nr:NAD(P)H-hydrate dehydratase [Trueperaceae bacterium]
MRVYSAAQIHALDRAAEAAGISPGELMGRAADGVVRVVVDRFPDARSALVLCGPGNNGGDGYGVAARLLGRGLTVLVLEVSAQPRTVEARAERESFVSSGGVCRALTSALLSDALNAAPDLVVDALFGVGMKRSLEGELAAAVAMLNEAVGPKVVSVDVPSGVDADSTALSDVHVRADLTVQLAGHKLASLCHPARTAYGETTLVDLGIPADIMDAGSDTLLVDEHTAGTWLTNRAPDANKYSAGTVCVVAGSDQYLGAAELACRGAWRGGAGLVTLVVPVVGNDRFAGAWPETIFAPWDSEAWPPTTLSSKLAGSLVVGPGLAPRVAARLNEFLSWAPGPVVIDAAALGPEVLDDCVRQGQLGQTPDSAMRVVTPHAGEAARILGTSAAEVATKPLEAAHEISRRLGSICVLKGPTTVIADPSGRAAISTFGHPGMASGGTGDVLAGLLGALLADPAAGGDLFTTVAAGVAAHSLAGQIAAEERGRSLIASDLVESLPLALRRLSGGRW